MNKMKYVFVELADHLPFSIFGVAVGMVVVGMMTFFAVLLQAEEILPEAAEEIFHVLHPVHILFSALASTAMFWKHEKRRLKASLVGFFSSILICGVSDILIPFFGGMLIGEQMHFHLCLLKHPGLVIPFALVGVCAGLFVNRSVEHSTIYSHSAHVLISSMASLLYLISFGVMEWTHMIGGVFMITIIAVMIPCCASDIAFPVLCVHRDCHHD